MEVSGKRDLNEQYNILCQPCEDRELSTRSDGFCTRCEEHMCKPCFDIHKQFKLNRGHTLADENELIITKKRNDDLETCDQHINETVKYYCSEHEQVGCGDCMLFGHRPCKIEYIRDIGKAFKDSEEFKDFVKGAEKCQLHVKEIAISIKNNKIQARDINDKFMQDVHEFSEDIVSHINKLKTPVINEAESLQSMDIENMDKLEKENEALMNELSHLTELFESQTDQPNKLFINYVLQKPNLKRIQEIYERIKQKSTIKNYQFKPDGSLERSVRECKNLGTILEKKEEADEEDQQQYETVFDEPGKGTEELQGSIPEESQTKIVVSNLPFSAHGELEHLEMFFENTRKFGGGPVFHAEFDEESSSAVVEFEEPEAVDVVMNKCPIKMMGQTVEVEVFKTAEPVPMRTIEVTGPCNIVCEDQLDTLEMYFESERRSGEGQQQSETVHDEPYKDTEEQQEPDNEERPTKIVVTNLPSTAHEDFLEMFFENTRKFGGGNVFNVEFDEESSSAVIEFEEPEAVDVVLNKCPIKMMGQLVDIGVFKPAEPVSLCTIEVTGPCSIVCEDKLHTLEMYFESERRSGGGEVVECKFDYENSMLLVTFESEEVAHRVEERASHVVMKERLNVKLHDPVKESKKSDKAENVREKEPTPEPVRTVKVKGVDKSSTRDTVEFYFEHSRRSGGGEIETIKSDEEEEDVLYLTFKREKEFDVLKKIFEKYKLEGAALKVSPIPVSNCIIVANLAGDVTKDTVTYYFENNRKSGGGPVDKVKMNEDDTCLVYFVDYTIIERVLGNKHKLGEKALDVKLYQDSLGRSEGEATARKLRIPDSIVINNVDPGTLKFMNHSKVNLIERVLGKIHQLSGQVLDVKLYQDSLGRPEGESTERKLRLPDPIVMNNVDPQKVKFMNHSKVNREALEKQLNDCYTLVRWPKDKGDVLLECTLTSSTKDCFKLVKRWKEDALKIFSEFMKYIIVKQVSVLQEIWSKVMQELKGVNISNPEAVAIFVDRSEGLVTVVGNMKVSETLSKNIEDIAKKVLIEVQNERERTKEVVTVLKSIETRMLLADKFPGKMEEQFSDLKVKINLNKNEIVFYGPPGKVRDAKLKMYEINSNFAKITTDKLTALSAGLYLLKQTKDHIVKKLKANGVTAVWDLTGGCLVVYSTSGEYIQNCVDIVRGSVIENTIALKKASKSVVNSEKWQDKIDELHAFHAGKCHIQVSEDSSKVHICGTDDVAMDVVDSVKKFLRLNTVMETKVPCVKNSHRLIERHHKNELTNILKDLQNYHVQIISVPGYGGFKIRGTEDGVHLAKSRLLALFQRVKQREHTLQKPGLAEHMQTPIGKDNLNTIESTFPCVVSVKDNDSFEQFYDTVPLDSGVTENIGVKGLTIIAYCTAYDCRKIFTAEGDITELTVEMLIHPTDDKLRLTGGIGKAIRKGGSVIQKECADYLSVMDRLEYGKVFVSSAGELKADYIAHVIGPLWKGGMLKDEMLQEAVFKCLQMASAKQLKSIAIPGISCGGFRYPVREATSIIVGAVKNFFLEVQDSTVTDIYLCDMELHTVEGFNEALQREFGSSFQKYSLTQKPLPTPQKPKKGLWGLVSDRFVHSSKQLKINSDCIYTVAIPRDFLETYTPEIPSIQGFWRGQSGQDEHTDTTPKGKKSPNTVTFLIRAMHEDTINKATEKLECVLEKEVHRKMFHDSIIKKMDDSQLMAIRAIARQHHLEIILEPQNERIQISGVASNVMSAADKIHRIIIDARKKN